MPRYLLGQAPGGGAPDMSQLLIPIATEGIAGNEDITKSFAGGMQTLGLKNVTGKDAEALIRMAGNSASILMSNEPDPILKAQGVMNSTGPLFGVAFSFAGPVVSALAAQYIPMLMSDITGRAACTAKGYDLCIYAQDGDKPGVDLAWDYMRRGYKAAYAYRLFKKDTDGWLTEDVFKALMAPVTESEIEKYGLAGVVKPSTTPLTKSVIDFRIKSPEFDPDKIGALTTATEAKLRREAVTAATIESINKEKSLKALDPNIYRGLEPFKDLLTSQKKAIYEAIKIQREKVIRKQTLMVFGIGAGITAILSSMAFIIAKKTKRA